MNAGNDGKKSALSAPLIFPHNVGPGIRYGSTALLYHGRLIVGLPGWVSMRPIKAFSHVCSVADAKGTGLLPLFRTTQHFLSLSITQGRSAIGDLEPLQPWVTRAMLVYPGNRAAYAAWDSLREQCLPLALWCLRDPVHMCTASREFVWRVWEYALELGGNPDEPDSVDAEAVIAALEDRARELGSPDLVLAECLLNRYCMPRSDASGSYAIGDPDVLALLARIGSSIEEGDNPEVRKESLAFFFFDNVLSKYVGPLVRPRNERIALLLDKHGDALTRLRAHCKREASELLAYPPTASQLEDAVQQTLSRMKDEAADLANINAAAMRDYVSELARDPKIWGAVSGLIGIGVTDTGSAIVNASLAVTLFASVGATAVKGSQERRKILKESPWSVVYFARQHRDS